MQQVNNQLRFAHAKQYLHRDLSPSKMIIFNDKAYLIDWGEASKDNNEPSQPTATYAYCSLKVQRAVVLDEKVLWTKQDFESLFFTFLAVASGHRLPWKHDRLRADSNLKQVGLVKDTQTWTDFVEQRVVNFQNAKELSKIRQMLFTEESPEVDFHQGS
jgi:serine/threonine protein kinase